MDPIFLGLVGWFGTGAFGAWLGIRDLHRRYPSVACRSDYLLYATSVLGPFNVVAVWIVFFSGLNPR